MTKSRTTRERIVDKAAQVFYQHGYRATGVESIARAAGITKATLYHHFHDKDQLIEESLRHLSEFHRSQYRKAWNKKGLSPRAKLLVLFDALAEQFTQPDCYGCPFINAAGEFTDRHSPVRVICEEHYAYLRNNLEQFAADAKIPKPALLADRITACIAGAYTAWFVGNRKDAAKQGKMAAKLAIQQHLQKI